MAHIDVNVDDLYEDITDRLCARMGVNPHEARLAYKLSSDKPRAALCALNSRFDFKRAVRNLLQRMQSARTRIPDLVIVDLVSTLKLTEQFAILTTSNRRWRIGSESGALSQSSPTRRTLLFTAALRTFRVATHVHISMHSSNILHVQTLSTGTCGALLILTIPRQITIFILTYQLSRSGQMKLLVSLLYFVVYVTN
jgi:hypothetical protein